MQPGVFALSGWDLVGALPLPVESVAPWLEDQDYRWTNRGAFDLVDDNPDASASPFGMPKAHAVYGGLREQLADAESFASQLRTMLQARHDAHVAQSTLMSVPEPHADGLVALVLMAPDGTWMISVANFGPELVEEAISLPDVLAGATAVAVYSTAASGKDVFPIDDRGGLSITLGPRHACLLKVDAASPNENVTQ
jgi:hypothetical protein